MLFTVEINTKTIYSQLDADGKSLWINQVNKRPDKLAAFQIQPIKNEKMRKMRELFLILFTLLSLTIFIGCEKEDLTIKSIALDKSTLPLTINSTYQFVVSFTPSNLQTPNYIWTTSDNSIVSVNDKGEISARSVGEATITVYTPDKTLQSSCKVNVLPINAIGISFNVKYLDLLIEQEEILTYIITPVNTTDKQVTWSSSDYNIATVDNTGKVKAVGIGEAKITAKTSNLISDVCNIKVNPIKASSISLNKIALSIEISDKETIVANLLPANTTNRKIFWSSSNTNIASVAENGEVTGLDLGSTIITAKSDDGGFTAICNVEVKLKGLVLTKTSINALPNQQELIHVKYSTSDIAYTHATWSSSNPSVAKVTSDGNGFNSALIETLNTGAAIITATSADGLKTAICNVTVKEINDYVSLIANPKSMSSSSLVTTYTLGCNFTNPTNSTIYINSVLLLDGSNQLLQIAEIQGSRYLNNGSLKTYFSPITMNENWSSAQSKLATYKVMVQYSINGNNYQIMTNINPNRIGL